MATISRTFSADYTGSSSTYGYFYRNNVKDDWEKISSIAQYIDKVNSATCNLTSSTIFVYTPYLDLYNYNFATVNSSGTVSRASSSSNNGVSSGTYLSFAKASTQKWYTDYLDWDTPGFGQNEGNKQSNIRLTFNLNYTIPNLAPPNPTINYPKPNGTCYSTKPYIQIQLGDDQNKDNQVIEYAFDSTDNILQTAAYANNTIVNFQSEITLSLGQHTLYLRASDGELTSSWMEVNFNIIEPFDNSGFMKNQLITIDDVIKMRDGINALNSYYGLNNSWTELQSNTKILHTIVQELELALKSFPSIAASAIPNSAIGDKCDSNNFMILYNQIITH